MEEKDHLWQALPGPEHLRFDWPALWKIEPLRDAFKRMQETDQHRLWHGEGDVWTHTQMVCEELLCLKGFEELLQEQMRALSLAALLHDVGKPACTKRDADGVLISPHHAAVGSQMARKLLWQEFGMCGNPEDMRLREMVCQLIRHHGRPIYLLESEDPAHMLLRMAALGEQTAFSLRMLCMLAEADARGRIAGDVQEYLDRVELCREMAREYSCLDNPYTFRSSYTRRQWFAGKNVWQDQVLYDDTWGEVQMLCGLPGTGKDTWTKAHYPGLPVLSLDEIRMELDISAEENQGKVVQEFREEMKALLRSREPFIISATSLTRQIRSGRIQLIEDYHAKARIIYLETEWEENLRRNADRPMVVPEMTVDRMLGRLEVPEPAEAEAVQWLCV